MQRGGYQKFPPSVFWVISNEPPELGNQVFEVCSVYVYRRLANQTVRTSYTCYCISLSLMQSELFSLAPCTLTVIVLLLGQSDVHKEGQELVTWTRLVSCSNVLPCPIRNYLQMNIPVFCRWASTARRFEMSHSSSSSGLSSLGLLNPENETQRT